MPALTRRTLGTHGPRGAPANGDSALRGTVPSESTIPGRAEAVRTPDQILERIFAPTPRVSPTEQAERTLRRPKQLVYVACSNRNFHWRMQLTRFVLEEGRVPITPFMLFDYYLLHTVPKELVREAMNNLIARCDEIWVFGNLSLGLRVQVGIAKRIRKPVRYFDISDLPDRVVSIPEAMVGDERHE